MKGILKIKNAGYSGSGLRRRSTYRRQACDIFDAADRFGISWEDSSMPASSLRRQLSYLYTASLLGRFQSQVSAVVSRNASI